MQNSPIVGVLALQGDFADHLATLAACGAQPVAVRRPSDLTGLDGVILPGGESTTIDKLMRIFDIKAALQDAIANGLPVYGSCAGMILLAQQLRDAEPSQQTLGSMDIVVRRNAFGRQVDSFEEPIVVKGLQEHVHAVFIRAPWVESYGPHVDPLATVHYAGSERVVAVRQDALLATSFHPEVTDDHRIHQMFLEML